MILSTILLLALNNCFGSADVTEGFWIQGRNPEVLDVIKSRPELTVDHIKDDGFELYGPLGLESFLKQNKIHYTALNEKISNQIESTGYLSPEEVESELQALAKKYPMQSKLYSIGKSVKNRDLWVMKLSTNAVLDDDRPEFKYIANMHGDEIVGRELMLRFIKDCLENYSTDPLIHNLLDKFQIHILVSMNPDGAKNMRRGNSNNIDLNRDFPDFDSKDNIDTPKNRAPETQAVMNWQGQHHFGLSANFHGGAEVVNYPWDTIAAQYKDEYLVKELSLEYAQNAAYIGVSTVFSNGITNGFAWYEVKGGMQDWSIYWRKDLQLTIELSNIKWPAYSTIDYYYQQNRPALIHFIERLETIKSL
jgi:predicted deacylase